jgi:hypothetical protein
MGASNRFGFVQIALGGGLPTSPQIGWSEGDASSAGALNQNNYYLVIDGGGNVGVLSQDVVGLIAYDIVNLRWAFILTKACHLSSVATPYSNDFGQINDFMVALPTPLLVQSQVVETNPPGSVLLVGQEVDITGGNITRMCDPIK